MNQGIKMPISSSEWKNRMQVRYDQPDAAGPVDLNKHIEQCLRDWNRWANSKENCPIYIKGIQLSKFEPLPNFDKEEELLIFLKENLFSKNTLDDVIKAAMSHFHQGGIFNATQMSISRVAGVAATRNKYEARPSEAEQRINLDCDETGNILIKEENTYKKYTEGSTNHSCKGRKSQYYAKTETKYRFTPEKDIYLISFEVDCPKNKLKYLFDESAARKNIMGKILGYMQKILRGNLPRESVTPVDPPIIYTHNSK